jgi:hypothetical protein
MLPEGQIWLGSVPPLFFSVATHLIAPSPPHNCADGEHRGQAKED